MNKKIHIQNDWNIDDLLYTNNLRYDLLNKYSAGISTDAENKMVIEKYKYFYWLFSTGNYARHVLNGIYFVIICYKVATYKLIIVRIFSVVQVQTQENFRNQRDWVTNKLNLFLFFSAFLFIF